MRRCRNCERPIGGAIPREVCLACQYVLSLPRPVSPRPTTLAVVRLDDEAPMAGPAVQPMGVRQ